MNTKVFLLVLLFLPPAAWAQDVRADKEAQDLFQFYRKFFIQNPAQMAELDVFKDGTVLHGFLSISGKSTSTHTDLIGLAQNVGNTVRTFFSIPNDYQFVVEQGGLGERPAIMLLGGDRRNVTLALTIDGVPLKRAFVQTMFDMEGHLRSIVISLPRLRPEIVAAVRGPTIDLFGATVAIRLDANQLPEKNPFDITPNTDLKYVDLKKVALAQEPYIVYECLVEAARYTVNAKTGAVVSRMSMITR
jgi:hypothetical protein